MKASDRQAESFPILMRILAIFYRVSPHRLFRQLPWQMTCVIGYRLSWSAY